LFQQPAGVQVPFLKTRVRFALAATAGVLLALAFPTPGIAGLAWIAPGLLAFSALGLRGGEAFRIGYVGGLAFWLLSIRWLLLMPVTGLPIVGWAALSAYVALYFGIWTWLVSRFPRPCDPASATDTGPGSGDEGDVSWGRRALWALSGAGAWVSLEMLRGWLFSGFPWNPIGVTQYQMAPLIQMAAWTGVHGVSFLVVWGSLGILLAVLRILRRPGARGAWVAELAVPMLVVAVLFHLGARRLAPETRAPRTLRVACVQPSIPQTMIWDGNETTNRYRQLIGLTHQALAAHPDLLVWPESAMPNPDRVGFEALMGLIRSNQVWFLFGADDVENRVAPDGSDASAFYNSAFLFDRDGQFASTYRKRNLVIFGEYVPLVRWLPFLKYFTPIEGGFAGGTQPGRFCMPDLGVELSPLICFEDIFEGTTRESVTDDTSLIVNVTNDGWFEESGAQWQHAAAAVFRAVENGVPLLRCANNGITCVVDGRGRIRQVFRDGQGSVYGRGIMMADVPLADRGGGATVFRRHGSVFGWLCVAGTLGVLAGRRSGKGGGEKK
jgi:apolipoprotein N-acyltransferase